ncbi:hemolysin family protein [Actinomadura rupiterrae]|uniref:hemolysin family protein n=1 Tax=Actinomadura rupiterrae TaxID=559627 RepID=UPI0027E33F90|nr:CNNM domain-containing protein [Actinomadura rupiterrae]MCP2338118.1 CBS domain containing-hemolysin-like protein [Actinomadura rupiterrae]
MAAALGLLAVLVLTAATGYFVAQEFAFVTADRPMLAERAAQGDRASERAVRVMERLSFMLSGAQLGITVTALVVGFIAKPALADLLAPLLRGLGVPDGAVGGISVTAGFVLATVVQMVLGELFPKNLALARAEPLARALARSTLVYLAIAGPVIRLFDAAANRLVRAAGMEPVEELHHGATLEELGHIIGESGEQLGDQADLLERALEFSDRDAEEVMVPRVDVVTVPAEALATELSDVVTAHGHSRYPVVGDSVDDVIGVVGLDELIRLSPEQAAVTRVRDLVRPAVLLPSSLPLPQVVAELRRHGDPLACVVDEYGGFAGLLTWEDVAEELVGEIADENDEDPDLAIRSGEWWTTDAGLRVDEVEHETGIPLPEGDYETVAGLLLRRLGRVAEEGDVVHVELPRERLDDPPREAVVEVVTVHRHVPELIRIRVIPSGALPHDPPPNNKHSPNAPSNKARPDSERPNKAPSNSTPSDGTPSDGKRSDDAPSDNAHSDNEASDNASPNDTPPEDAQRSATRPDGTRWGDTRPGDTRSEDVSSDNAPPHNASPRDASPRDASPRDASPRDASPRDASPRDASPRDASLDDAVSRPDDTSSRPDDVVSRSDDAVSRSDDGRHGRRKGK